MSRLSRIQELIKKNKISLAIFLSGCIGIILLFYAIGSYTDIPYMNYITCFSFYGMALSASSFSLFQHISKKAKVLIFILSFMLSGMVWTLFSYVSYYQSARLGASQTASVLYKTIDIALHQGIDNPKMQAGISALLKSSGETQNRAQICLYKNGIPYAVQKPSKDWSTYQKEEIPDIEMPGWRDWYNSNHGLPLLQLKDLSVSSELKFPPIHIGSDTYTYFYEYYNRPVWYIGVLRSVSFSTIFPTKNDADFYISYRLFQRSQYFAGAFLLLYIVLYTIVYFFTKQEAKLKEKQTELQQTIHEKDELLNQLHVFEAAYNKVQSDFRSGISDSINNLQHIQSGWDKAEMYSAKLSRHDVLNRIMSLKSTPIEELNPDNNFYEFQKKNRKQIGKFKQILASIGKEYHEDLIKDIYDYIFAPWIKQIRNELRTLEDKLEITPLKENVGQVVKQLKTDHAVPKDLLENKNTGYNFILRTEKTVPDNKYLLVIPNKLQSVVFNVIQNSSQAIQRYIMEQGDFDMTGKIIFQISSSEDYLILSISDNGGGFPDDILKDVYKRPVKTTKNPENRKYGEATSYIGFFLSMMKGKIEAENFIWEDGRKGARTIIYLPYLDSESKKDSEVF